MQLPAYCRLLRPTCAYSPRPHLQYDLLITSPGGLGSSARLALPDTKAHGAVVRQIDSSMGLQLKLSASLPGFYDVSVSRREFELGSVRVSTSTKPNSPTDVHLTLPRSSSADGVLRVTVHRVEDGTFIIFTNL
jgi:hypothetical protein